MKRLFVLMLVLNPAFFGWQYYEQRWGAEVRPAPVPVTGVAGLVLLKELPPEQIRPLAAKPGAEKAALAGESRAIEKPLPQSEPQVCYRMGPFVAGANPAPVRAWLRRAKVPAVIEEQPGQEFVGYWVFIPPRESLRVAKDMLAEIKSKGVEDAYVIAGGSRKYAVALGLFSKQNEAESQLKRLKELGFPAEMDEQHRAGVTRWLHAGTARRGVPKEVREALSSEFPKLGIETSTCS